MPTALIRFRLLICLAIVESIPHPPLRVNHVWEARDLDVRVLRDSFSLQTVWPCGKRFFCGILT
jgi:hypothetical protein